jgi:curved DNA-binding protein
MAIEFKDYYKTLGVARTATPDEIKKAFRKLARQHHPDVAKDKKSAEVKFKEINEANEVLSDPEKRKQYDELGANWQNGASPPRPGAGGPQWRSYGGPQGRGGDTEFHFGGTGFSDFFEQFFSGGQRYGFSDEDDGGFRSAGFGGARQKTQGSDIEGDILVTLHEAMHGTVRPISLQIRNPRTGTVETRTFKVRIPAGASDERRIRVPGQGEPGLNGGPAGDLYLRVRYATHPDFRVNKSDLYHDLDVAPWEAVLGTNVVIPTLESSIKLNIPPGTASGRHLRVRGHGLPKSSTGERGDLYVVVNIQVPEKLTPEEKAKWEELRSISKFDPRE